MDYQIFEILRGLTGRHWLLDWLFIFLGGYLPYILAFSFLFLIFWTHKKWHNRLYFIFLSSLALLISRGIFVETIRFFYYRPRPFKLLGFDPLINYPDISSMPSGHAAIFFALALLIYYINKDYIWYFIAGAVLVSLGRILVGVHWPADILVGSAIGMGSALLAKYLLPYKIK